MKAMYIYSVCVLCSWTDYCIYVMLKIMNLFSENYCVYICNVFQKYVLAYLFISCLKLICYDFGEFYTGNRN